MESGTKEREPFDGEVRPLKETDIPTLRKISEHWLQDFGVIAQDEVEDDMATLRESLETSSGKSMFVAQTADGEVIGMMGLSSTPKQVLERFAITDKPSELIIAYVHPDYVKGKGVGTALINAVQKLAKSQGKKEILLESGPRHRESGHPFYDRLGYERVGVIVDYYGKGLHTQVWRNKFQEKSRTKIILHPRLRLK